MRTGTLAYDRDTKMGGVKGSFPTTHWSQLAEVRDTPTREHREVLNSLITRYWKPTYCYVRRHGYGNEDAKDLVQEFFTSWLAKDLFARADRERGRFKAYLLSSLDNFLANARRAAHAQKRRPPHGFVSIHKLATDDVSFIEPAQRDTPEMAFGRAWATELVLRVLKLLEEECSATGKTAHFDLFRQRVIEPALEGTRPPALRELAGRLDMTEKQAANRLLTARRAYQRLLRNEIWAHASSEEDVTLEMRELFDFLSNR